jgi:hypothetical protein
VAIAEAVPSVAGGPADTAKWDEYFGPLDSFHAGSEEEEARAHKAAELPASLAGLYTEVRRMRDARSPDARRLTQIAEEVRRFGDEQLLLMEIDELLARKN